MRTVSEEWEQLRGVFVISSPRVVEGAGRSDCQIDMFLEILMVTDGPCIINYLL